MPFDLGDHPARLRPASGLISEACKVQSVLRPEIRSHVLCKPGRNNNRRAFPPTLNLWPRPASSSKPSGSRLWEAADVRFSRIHALLRDPAKRRRFRAWTDTDAQKDASEVEGDKGTSSSNSP